MKSYTDIEQSKKLAEILPIESADMCWCNNSVKGVNYTDEFSANLCTVKEMKELFDTTLNGWDKYWKLIPCWSLAALLDILPKTLEDGFYDEYELNINMIDKKPEYIGLDNQVHSDFPYNFNNKELLDNIVESIIWLNKQDLL